MRPVIGVSASRTTGDGVEYDRVRCRYLSAVYDVAECIPIIVPNCVGDRRDADTLLQLIDGLILTGDRSNIAAEWYGEAQIESAAQLDPARDLTALTIIPRAVELGIPLLAICRGFQELNVSLGGDLYQDLGSEERFIRHKEDESLPRDLQYQPLHDLHVTGNVLRTIAGRNVVRVNSLHKQGVRKLAPGLDVEAVASDGLVEAVSVRGAAAFTLGVQWHPEWHVKSDELCREIFKTFGVECWKHWLKYRDGSERREPTLPRYLKVR